MKNRKIENVIVGVDLSDYSKVVVKEAQGLAKEMGVPVTYVYVFEDIAVFDEAFEFRKNDVRDYYTQKVREVYKLRRIDTVIVRYGRPYQEIIDVAKKFRHPMIVAGHRGFNAVARFFLGSTAERLAMASPFPVWIHRGKTTVLPRKILIPCDLTARTRQTILGIAPLQKMMKAKVELIHVVHEPVPLLDYPAYTLMHREIVESARRQVERFQKKFPSLKAINTLSSVAATIQDFASRYDIVAISPRSHKVTGFFLGSVTAKIIRAVEKPILIIP